MIKLVACDLDGTLFNREIVVSDTNIKAIRDAQAAGIEFLIATGRAPLESKIVIAAAKLKTGFINLNGALVFDAEGKLMVKHAIEHTQVKQLFTLLRQTHFYFEVITADQVYTEDVNARITNIAHLLVDLNPGMDFRTAVSISAGSKAIMTMQAIDSFDELLAQPNIEVLKVIAFDARGREAFAKVIPQINQLGLTVSASSATNIEINAAKAQKGIALLDYARKKGYQVAETAAIGDNLNDLSMIKMAGIGVAMGNAIPLIKAEANLETKDNNSDGVAHILRKFMQMNTRG
ncbi:MAG: Cof-type HAD-IIB family hydrolase [Lactobacillus sp.]|nr:Cof-type HAD-IIB family hydrolase [Lactobacillus sp.]MDN6052022.1 Cof-type HAD-IIB family hydrolase [Lactobacillus sp.]